MTPDDSVMAAELALGLLGGDERAAALRRAMAEPAFADEVAQWQRRFAALALSAPAIDPPAIAPPPAANDPARPWRWATLATGLVAATLAGLLMLRPAVAPPPAPPVRAPLPLTAAMAPTDAGKPFAALYDRASGAVRVAAGVDVPQGRVAQLWRIGADGVPRSLGLLRTGATSVVTLSAADRAALAAGATLAISIEPPGGAPGAAPTGPVVATGVLTAI